MSTASNDERGATIYDVAREAGVSASTVSRTFSRPGRVSSRTAVKVRAVAERLGYRSEEIFRAATPTHRQTIGLAISDVTNPFYFPIIRGAESAAAEAGFTLILADAQESDDVERKVLRRLIPLIDGLVIASSRISDTDLRTLAKSVPVVVLNRFVSGMPCVIADTPRGVRRAVEHLGELGHHRICYVSGPEASWANGARWRALTEATHELELTACRIGPFEPTVEGGVEAARLVAEKKHTALVVYNDLMAMGIMRGLGSLGLKVPEEVSIVGFDNIFAADLVTPGLTTVAAPLAAVGETAVRNVIAFAGGARSTQPGPTVVPVKLIVRGSTAAPAG